MNRTKLLLLCGSVILVMGLASLFVLVDRSVSRALAIQRQLTDDQTPTPTVQKRLAQDLTRMVDKMDRDQLRELSDQIRNQSREILEKHLVEYLDAPANQRNAVLDRHIEVSQQWRAVYEALRTDAFRMRGARQRGRNQAGNRRQRGSERGDAARANTPPRDERTNRQQDAEQDARRQQFAEYWQAMRDRAEERGVELRGFGRRGRRGRTG